MKVSAMAIPRLLLVVSVATEVSGSGCPFGHHRPHDGGIGPSAASPASPTGTGGEQPPHHETSPDSDEGLRHQRLLREAADAASRRRGDRSHRGKNRRLETSSEDINAIFFGDLFGNVRSVSYSNLPNTIIAEWDKFQLYQNGRSANRTWDSPPGDPYVLSKTVSHSVLGAFGVCYTGLSLSSGGGGCEAMYGGDDLSFSPDAFQQTLGQLRNITVDVDLKAAVMATEYPALQEASYKIIDYFTDMMDEIESSDCSEEVFSQALDTKFLGVMDIIHPLTAAAAGDRIKTYGGVLKSIRKELGEEAWADIFVVSSSGAPPRTGNLESSIILKEMMVDGGENPSGTRFFHEENIQDNAQTQFLITGRTSDKVLSNSVFGNPVRMSKDLLADYATEYLGSFFMPGYPDTVKYQEVYYQNNAYATVGNIDGTSDASASSILSSFIWICGLVLVFLTGWL